MSAQDATPKAAPDIPPALLERIGADLGRRLFVPSHYDFDSRAGLLDFIRQHTLATLASSDTNGLRATAAAMIVDTVDGEAPATHLLGHLAARNPHAERVRAGAPVVAVFHGPGAYISPRWNRENPSLPTWSYLSVQVHGHFQVIDAPADKRAVLERTIAHMERDADRPWRLDDAPPELVATLLEHIVAFRLHIDDMQGIRRLNQNRQPADRAGIIAGLRGTGAAGAEMIADLMAADLRDG